MKKRLLPGYLALMGSSSRRAMVSPALAPQLDSGLKRIVAPLLPPVLLLIHRHTREKDGSSEHGRQCSMDRTE